MSETNAAEADIMMCRCASCGATEADDIKLKTCTGCKSVRYCSIKCQKEHRSQHKRACKKKAAELRDEILFRQTESTDCPICLLPLPLDPDKLAMISCCARHICAGCEFANALREIEEGLKPTCPFCRLPAPHDDAKMFEVNIKRRAEADDPAALGWMGGKCQEKGDYNGAFEFWKRAAELGDSESHYQLSVMYHGGYGVEKDEKKGIRHLEEAAIGGDIGARVDLGVLEQGIGRFERAEKHFTIAANLGCEDAMSKLRHLQLRGVMSFEDLNTVLRAHKAALDAMKSPQREAGEANLRRAARERGYDS
eukprot:scaffold8343_cov94-Skeletonema_dohrnii-CCMP3373.AAC.4